MNNATPQPTADLDAGLANLREYGYTIHPGFIDGHRLVQLRERLLEQADMERELGLANGGSASPNRSARGASCRPCNSSTSSPTRAGSSWTC